MRKKLTIVTEAEDPKESLFIEQIKKTEQKEKETKEKFNISKADFSVWL